MNKIPVLFLCVSGVTAGFASECSTAAADKAQVVASINGQTLSREEFNRRVSARLFQARNTFYEAERKALDEIVNEMLLEQRAREEKTTVPALLDRHVNSQAGQAPTDDALRVYYEGLDVNEPFDSVKDKIVTHLRDKRIAKAKAAYLASLRNDAKLNISLAPPRLQVPVDNMPLRGNPSAPVRIIEYADYECPYCQQIQPALDKLSAEYKDKVAFAYKDVPLPNHPNAQKAAEAKHCAAAQGKYWEYHDLLVANKAYQTENLKEHARSLRLNMDAFDRCVEKGEQTGVVSDHVREAQALGLQGTPSFFINGRFFSGALTYEKLREIVEEELRAAGTATSQTAMR
jgi:protein-disulfide isomerase